ncbi:MAG TPA: hypothetical protein VIN07_02695 [Flavipsychrobacter sp.]
MNCCKNITLSLLCVLIVFSSFRNETERYGETITTQRGDEITFSRPKEREVVVGKSKVRRVTTEPPTPILLNGKKIHYFKDDHQDSLRELDVFQKAIDDYRTFQKMINSAIAKEKAHLPVGYYKYELTSMVVDERGYIAYYETKGILQHHPATNPFTKPVTIPVNPTSAYIINGIIAKQVSRMRYTPLIVNGMPTPYFSSFEYGFEKK